MAQQPQAAVAVQQQTQPQQQPQSPQNATSNTSTTQSPLAINNNSNTNNSNNNSNNNSTNSSGTQTLAIQQQQQQQQPNSNAIAYTPVSLHQQQASSAAAATQTHYNPTTPVHPGNMYMSAPSGVHHQHGGHVYSTMVPGQYPNVFVNNVTANVNLHGWPAHPVPTPYIQGGGSHHYMHGDMPAEQVGGSLLQPLQVALSGGHPGGNGSSAIISGRGSRRGRGRTGSGSSRRSDYIIQRHPPEGSPAPQQIVQQQSQMELQQQHQQQQQTDTQLMAGAPHAYAGPAHYAAPQYTYGAPYQPYFPSHPQQILHPSQPGAGQQPTGAPVFVSTMPFYNSYMGAYIYSPVLNQPGYQYIPASDDGQGDERHHAEAGGMMPPMWHTQPVYTEDYGIPADMHGPVGDELNHNSSSLASSCETPSMISPNYPVYDTQIHELQQQMGVMQIYEDPQLAQMQAMHGNPQVEFLEEELSESDTIQMLQTGTIITGSGAPPPSLMQLQITDPQMLPPQPPHHLIATTLIGMDAQQQQQQHLLHNSAVDQHGGLAEIAASGSEIVGSLQGAESMTSLNEAIQRSSENIAEFQPQRQQMPVQQQQQHVADTYNNNNNNKPLLIVANEELDSVPNNEAAVVQQLFQQQQAQPVLYAPPMTKTHSQQTQQQQTQQQQPQQQQPQHQQQQSEQVAVKSQQKPQYQQQNHQHQYQQQQSLHYQQQQHYNEPRKQQQLYSNNQQHSRRKYDYNNSNAHHQHQTAYMSSSGNNNNNNNNHVNNANNNIANSSTNNNSNEPWQLTTKSMSWTNSATQKKSTASVAVTASPNAAAASAGNGVACPQNSKSIYNSSQATKLYGSQQHNHQYHQQQQQQQQSTSNYNQQHQAHQSQAQQPNHCQPTSNQQEQQMQRNQGVMKVPSSPVAMATTTAVPPANGQPAERKRSQVDQPKLCIANSAAVVVGAGSDGAGNAIAGTSTASTSVAPSQLVQSPLNAQQQPVQQQLEPHHHTQQQQQQQKQQQQSAKQQQTDKQHHEKHQIEKQSQEKQEDEKQPPPQIAAAACESTTIVTAVFAAAGSKSSQFPSFSVHKKVSAATANSSLQATINLAPPPAPAATPAGTPSWASLFASKSASASTSTSPATQTASAAVSGPFVPPSSTIGNAASFAPVSSATAPALPPPYASKKPVAKVAPYEGLSIVASATPPIVTPGAMSYTAAAAQCMPPAAAVALKPLKAESPVLNRQLDEWTLRYADYLAKCKSDLTPLSLRPRGLTNRSNYCYINSILQALLGCAPFCNLLRSIPRQVAAMSEVKTPTVNAMSSFMANFSTLPSGLQRLRTSNNNKGSKGKDELGGDLQCDTAFEPTEIYRLWNESRDEHVEGRQEDAEEFLGYVLNKLNDELLEVIKLLAKPTVEQNGRNELPEIEDGDEWQMICNNRNKGSVTRLTDCGRTPLSDIFRGELRSRLQREGEHSTDVIQPFFTLQLNIEKAASVKEALEILVGRDQLEGVIGSKSKQEVVAWQQMTLEKLPIVLILHLKWFDYRSDGCTKILKKVEFPVELKIDAKIMASKKSPKQRAYRLFAVVYHDGKEASKGHYITDVYHTGYGNWLRYDDSSVKPISENLVLQPRTPRVPYLLYYRRSDTLPAAITSANFTSNTTNAATQRSARLAARLANRTAAQCTSLVIERSDAISLD